MESQRSLIQISISYILLAMIGLYGLSSVGNIVEYIQHFHDGWTGISLGLGFGLTLFVSAYIASIAKTRQTRLYALLVAGCFGVSSAWFQMSIYLEGGASLYVAFALAFVPIVVGEIGIALLESSYSREHLAEHDAFESVRLQHELDETKQRLNEAMSKAQAATALQQEVETLQQQLSQLQTKAAADQKSATESRELATKLAEIAAERDALAARLDVTATEFQQMAVEVDMLPQRLRGELQTALEIIEGNQIATQNDFILVADWSRSKAQDVFRIAEALKLIRFDNNDRNAFVVRRAEPVQSNDMDNQPELRPPTTASQSAQWRKKV